MPELPANSIALAEHYLRLMFADGATFRTWTGTASQAAALEHLYRQALPEPGAGAARYTAAELDGYRPFVITYVGVEEGYRFDRAGIGAANEFDDSGTLFCQLEQTVDPGLTAQEVEISWLSYLGALLDGLKALAGQAGYLNITSGVLHEYGRATPDEVPDQGDFVYAVVSVSWRG